MVISLVATAAGCIPSQLSKLMGKEGGDMSKRSASIVSGLVTTEESAEERDIGPYGFRVTWIAWDSGFRGTELRIGDRIVGIDAHVYTRGERKELLAHGTAIGNYAESSYWAQRGAADGRMVTLHVWRKGKTFDVTGALRAERFYYADDGRPALAPGGPPRLGNDGFDAAWASWYERFVQDTSRILDGGFRRHGVNNRTALEAIRAQKPRIDHLTAHYPGPFAVTTTADWQLVHDVLLGAERTFTAADLEYRRLGEQRAADVAEAARSGREVFLAAHRQDLIEPFPAVDPIAGNLDRVRGKIIVLPAMTNRNWISEGGHGYLAAGDRQRGYYFVDSRSTPFGRVLLAEHRYREQVSPKLGNTYELIGRITGAPSLRYLGDVAVTGLEVEVVGATVGGAMFVDVGSGDEQEARFAGQDALTAVGGGAPPGPRATPSQIMRAAFAALKVGDQQAWSELYAPWYLSDHGGGRFAYYPAWNRGGPDDWVRARRVILDDVYDVEVADEGLVQRLTSGEEFEGAPVIDQVLVEVEHIGKFPEGYRPVTGVEMKRVWTLQRIDGGPWRITDQRGI